jgi:hypothetical protein
LARRESAELVELVLVILLVRRDAGIDRDVHGNGLRVESQKRPFLNHEEGSAKLLSLREPVTRILAPFLKRGFQPACHPIWSSPNHQTAQDNFSCPCGVRRV